MKYMILIYGEEKNWVDASQGVRDGVMAAYLKYVGELVQAGAMVAGDPLKPVSTADHRPRAQRQGRHHRRTVRRDQGAARRLLHRRRAESATRRSTGRQQVPGRAHGSIEVRPLMPKPA